MSSIRQLILSHTRPSRRHLTPSLALRLITPECQLWTAKEGEGPFRDPFWAFYWPGGQATARYILDTPAVVRNRDVLDLGCGCGAGAIAAAMVGAGRVVANDIDEYAVTASTMNAELNEVSIETSMENVIGTKLSQVDTVLVGDMFYDEEFAKTLFEWLKSLAAEGKTVLLGDPGRHGLTSSRRRHVTLLATYDLPTSTRLENHGFTSTSLWKVNR